MAKTWTAVLARIGTPTGDRRIIAPGALSSRDLPLPLMWQRVSGDGHSGAVTVGAIESLTIDNEAGTVTGSGRFLDVRGAAEAQTQVDAGVTGPSVDLFDDVDIVEVQKLIEAGVVGPDLTGNLDDLEYAVDDDGMIVITRARIAGATLVQIPAFAGVSIDMAEAETEAPFTLAASAAPAKTLPPLDWFARPDLDRLTPLTVSNTGRVFGHLAGRDTCHVGLPGCVTPPMGYSSYEHFHVAAQPTQEGVTLPVGTLVAGPRHANPELAFRAAQQHYDDPGAAVARVMVGEDEFGIWAAGWILPEARPEAVAVFKSSPVSGDWRWIGGRLELIAVCSVNTPGFPIPRARVGFAAQEQRTLIAAGFTPVEGPDVFPAPGNLPVNEFNDETARARWAWASRKG